MLNLKLKADIAQQHAVIMDNCCVSVYGKIHDHDGDSLVLPKQATMSRKHLEASGIFTNSMLRRSAASVKTMNKFDRNYRTLGHVIDMPSLPLCSGLSGASGETLTSLCRAVKDISSQYDINIVHAKAPTVYDTRKSQIALMSHPEIVEDTIIVSEAMHDALPADWYAQLRRGTLDMDTPVITIDSIPNED